jgi:hypothetical protein
MIQVNYSNMMKYKETMLPGNVVINTFQPKGKSVIDLDYNITFNEALFHSVPNGYNRIIIAKIYFKMPKFLCLLFIA